MTLIALNVRCLVLLLAFHVCCSLLILRASALSDLDLLNVNNLAEYSARPLCVTVIGGCHSRCEKAVLLLDEADVYLQRRDGLQLERNRLVATFLRTLEYYPGIFFLTTNMLQDFDAAILDRIQLKLQYHDLDSSARQAIFRHFSAKTGAEILEDEIRNFAEVSLNGRQIKNVIKLAHNVAMSEGVPLRADHIRSALRANGYTIPTPGSMIDNRLYDY